MKAFSLALGLAVSLPCALTAQEPDSARVRIVGVVHDEKGRPIGDVGILMLPGDYVTRTDASGRFGVDDLEPKAYFVSVRRLGFLPINQRVDVKRNTVLTFTMERRPQMLDTIVVTDQCSRVHYSGFLCRRQKGHGIFLTEADILARNPRFMADIFLGMKGFHVEPVATPYGPNRILRTTQSRCLVQLVNGRNPVQGDLLESDPRMRDATDELTLGIRYAPTVLIGVEIYPPGYDTPEEYAFRVIGTPGLGGSSGAQFLSRARRVPPGQERCVLVNYWTTASLPKSRKKD